MTGSKPHKMSTERASSESDKMAEDLDTGAKTNNMLEDQAIDEKTNELSEDQDTDTKTNKIPEEQATDQKTSLPGCICRPYRVPELWICDAHFNLAFPMFTALPPASEYWRIPGVTRETVREIRKLAFLPELLKRFKALPKHDLRLYPKAITAHLTIAAADVAPLLLDLTTLNDSISRESALLTHLSSIRETISSLQPSTSLPDISLAERTHRLSILAQHRSETSTLESLATVDVRLKASTEAYKRWSLEWIAGLEGECEKALERYGERRKALVGELRELVSKVEDLLFEGVMNGAKEKLSLMGVIMGDDYRSESMMSMYGFESEEPAENVFRVAVGPWGRKRDKYGRSLITGW